MAEQRYDFASDNAGGICPEAFSAIASANQGNVAPYGDDDLTNQLRQRIEDIFETECDAFPVFNGTGANALALAQLCKPFESIICHQYAHIETDECGACEFYGGGSKLIPIAGANGKIDLGAAEMVLAQQHGIHSHRVAAISITQSTELGTIYQPEEISAVTAFAAAHHMAVHMDGARFANAIGALRCPPREITWQAGVDVLCLGGTKNGLLAGEIIIFFNKKRSVDFSYRIKQGGQLVSKMRFLAAPWLKLFEDDTWVANALKANKAAKNLGERLAAAGAEVVYPVEANAVFLRLPERTAVVLADWGWSFYKFVEPDVYRLMCSWATSVNAIDELVADFMGASCTN